MPKKKEMTLLRMLTFIVKHYKMLVLMDKHQSTGGLLLTPEQRDKAEHFRLENEEKMEDILTFCEEHCGCADIDIDEDEEDPLPTYKEMVQVLNEVRKIGSKATMALLKAEKGG